MLDDTDRTELAALLVEELSSTRDRLATLERELTSIVEAADTANIDDEHDPEGSTIAYERALVISMIDTARSAVEDLERASAMVHLPDFGKCDDCGEPIGTERLLARPATTQCVGCSRRGTAPG